MAISWKVKSVPTLIFLKEKKEVDRVVGYQPALIREKITTNVNGA
jgi:thioredoxin-like negative regulator of GroEL